MAGAKRSGPFVVAYGEEEFYLDRIVTLGRSWKDRHVIYLDGDGMEDHEVVSYCEQSSYDGQPVVVVIDNAHKIDGEESLLAYVTDKDAEDDQTVVVAVHRSDKLPKVWQMAAAKGRLEHCKKLKHWETDALKGRILDEAKRLKIKLDKEVADVFVHFFGDNLGRIANELRKLAVIADGGLVTKKDIISVVTPDMPVNAFAITQAATNKDSKKALRLASVFFRNEGEGVAVPITGALLSEVEKLIVTRQMLDQGVEAKTIAEALGLAPFVVQKDIIPRAKKHTVPALLSQMNNLCRLDAQVKGAARSKRTLVELAILSIAA